jgi:hypothetical protein
VNEQTVGKEFEAWAHDEPEIKAVVMLGSRARESGQVGSSDDGSDWDFHVVTSDISLFKDATWTARAHLLTPLAYIARSGHVSRIVKSTGVFPNGEIDLVLLPLTNLRFAKLLMRIGIAERIPFVRDALSEMALVLLPGYRLVKGGHSWGKFFASVVTKIAPLRLSDHIVCELAEAYFVDYVSTRRKIMRGELIAAQRWLHTQLADTNFRLLHELRLRSNELSFPDGRSMAGGYSGICSSGSRMSINRYREECGYVSRVSQKLGRHKMALAKYAMYGEFSLYEVKVTRNTNRP